MARLQVQRGRQRKPSSARPKRRRSGRFPGLLPLTLMLAMVPRVRSFVPAPSILPPPEAARASARANVAPSPSASELRLRACPSGGGGLAGRADCDRDDGAAHTRREVLSRAATAAAAAAALPPPASAAPADDVREARALLLEAKAQLERVPPLLREERWDGVRTALMEAPLRDCWSKASPATQGYAEALGATPAGDELAALEGREELLQHLRFLDMAVYDNVFNPIATMGEASASKALIDCYYNDPKREYAASKKAIEDLLQLSE